ncbi:MAG: hypothetical protein M1828_002891 [Chrysothrix sp. TS-e1954]|nr:MAG: hypothetical protein M1828_002891 [Chrysothrix sp. TS-e1954]
MSDGIAWSGAVAHSDGAILKDIRLVATDSAPVPFIPETALTFLAYVDPRTIPLHLVAGSLLRVDTYNPSAQQWFREVLLPERSASSHNDLHCAVGQSGIGILFGVSGITKRSEAGGEIPTITELLVYASTKVPSSRRRLPTPPDSSPRLNEAEGDVGRVDLCALPLSSDLLYSASAFSNGAVAGRVQSHFLRPVEHHEGYEATSQKHDRLNNLFEEAAHERKRARRPHGSDVALAASRSLQSPALPPLRATDGRRVKLEDDTSRPSSAHRSRPSSSRATINLRRGSFPQSVGDNPFNDATVDARNKQNISRIVMVGMRMYGLKQNKSVTRLKKHTNGGSTQEAQADSNIPSQDQLADDDEFKTVYHQTYKGALFAFRSQINSRLLNVESIRGVTERLLSVFCNEPP